MRILISGSHGLVGCALAAFLKTQGHEVKKLVRSERTLNSDEVSWDPEQERLDASLVEGFDVFVNLAGESIASGRWNENKKRLILESRIKSTSLLAKTINKLQKPPKVLINASAIGYYGNRGDEVLTENSGNGAGFLADVCKRWESAAEPAIEKGVRVCYLRTGMVLSAKGGGLRTMLIPFKLGLGGVFGDGSQYISWIDLDDLTRIILFIIQTSTLKGPINAVAPEAVTNQEFTKILGKVLQRPTFLPMPAFAARLAFGEMADELLLSSQRVKPAALEHEDFRFLYPTLESSFKHQIEND